jgi:hypothetical protein
VRFFWRIRKKLRKRELKKRAFFDENAESGKIKRPDYTGKAVLAYASF